MKAHLSQKTAIRKLADFSIFGVKAAAIFFFGEAIEIVSLWCGTCFFKLNWQQIC